MEIRWQKTMMKTRMKTTSKVRDFWWKLGSPFTRFFRDGNRISNREYVAREKCVARIELIFIGCTKILESKRMSEKSDWSPWTKSKETRHAFLSTSYSSGKVLFAVIKFGADAARGRKRIHVKFIAGVATDSSNIEDRPESKFYEIYLSTVPRTSRYVAFNVSPFPLYHVFLNFDAGYGAWFLWTWLKFKLIGTKRIISRVNLCTLIEREDSLSGQAMTSFSCEKYHFYDSARRSNLAERQFVIYCTEMRISRIILYMIIIKLINENWSSTSRDNFFCFYCNVDILRFICFPRDDWENMLCMCISLSLSLSLSPPLHVAYFVSPSDEARDNFLIPSTLLTIMWRIALFTELSAIARITWRSVHSTDSNVSSVSKVNSRLWRYFRAKSRTSEERFIARNLLFAPTHCFYTLVSFFGHGTGVSRNARDVPAKRSKVSAGLIRYSRRTKRD